MLARMVARVLDSKGGDAERNLRLERLWQRHRDRVWRLMIRLGADADLADDLTQEVALRAHQGFADFREKANEFTWLYRIAVNVFQRYLERHRLEVVSWDDSVMNDVTADGRHTPEATVLAADLRPTVWAAVERLPEELRVTLILQVYEGLKYREIASILDVPVGTVMSRLHAARKRLREELKTHVL